MKCMTFKEMGVCLCMGVEWARDAGDRRSHQGDK